MQSATLRAPYELGPLPLGRAMETVDQQLVRASPQHMFQLARDVEQWPAYLAHYRYVRFRERSRDGGGLVEMSANRPFGLVNWPTWWLSEMSVDEREPAIRFRHIGGITKGMEVEWQFTRRGDFARSLPFHPEDTLYERRSIWNNGRPATTLKEPNPCESPSVRSSPSS